MDVPCLDQPIRLVGTVFASVEQGSPREIENRVIVLLRTPLGWYEELPEYGIPDPRMSQGGVDLDDLRARIERWVPEATALLERDDDALAELVDRITVTVHG